MHPPANASFSPYNPMTTSELRHLEGKTVLVRSAGDTHNPPVAVRGSIHVVDTGETGDAKVEVVLEFPDMFNEPAHQRIIVLREDGIDHLLSSERNGAFELTIDAPLDRG